MIKEIAPNSIYHIYTRGTLQMDVFRDDKDYRKFLAYISKYIEKFPVAIMAFCLLPNHFHFLIKEPEIPVRSKWSNISWLLHHVLSSYGKYFCAKYHHSGHVFQGKFERKLVDNDEYLMQLIAYIHQNPVKKGLVTKAEDWPYSTSNVNRRWRSNF